MAIFALTNAKVVVNSVDLSSYVTDLTLELDGTSLDSTAMSSSGTHTYIGGLKDGKVDITFNQDFATSQVAATFWTIYTGNAPVAVTVNAVNAANSATNPQYQFNCLFTTFPFVTGKVGDLAQLKASGVVSGAVTLATA